MEMGEKKRYIVHLTNGVLNVIGVAMCVKDVVSKERGMGRGGGGSSGKGAIGGRGGASKVATSIPFNPVKVSPLKVSRSHFKSLSPDR